MTTPTDEEKMLAAAAHVSGCFLTALGPLFIWAIKKDSSPFVAYHALQATIFHVVAFVALSAITTVTCGFGFFVTPLLWLPALWLGWQAFQGSTEGYPGIAHVGRPPELDGPTN